MKMAKVILILLLLFGLPALLLLGGCNFSGNAYNNPWVGRGQFHDSAAGTDGKATFEAFYKGENPEGLAVRMTFDKTKQAETVQRGFKAAEFISSFVATAVTVVQGIKAVGAAGATKSSVDAAGATTTTGPGATAAPRRRGRRRYRHEKQGHPIFGGDGDTRRRLRKLRGLRRPRGDGAEERELHGDRGAGGGFDPGRPEDQGQDQGLGGRGDHPRDFRGGGGARVERPESAGQQLQPRPLHPGHAGTRRTHAATDGSPARASRHGFRHRPPQSHTRRPGGLCPVARRAGQACILAAVAALAGCCQRTQDGDNVLIKVEIIKLQQTKDQQK